MAYSTTVTFGGRTITPAPFVARSENFIDIGGRWGYSESFDVRGVITGSTSFTGALNYLTTLYSGQDQEFVVKTLDTIIVSGKVYLDLVDVADNQFFVGAPIYYNVQLRSYHVPSGVVDVSNEYSFSDGDNGVISVTHKISAKGIRDSNDPLSNATNYVSQFVGRNPYVYCTPLFLSSKSGILTSRSESIDRFNAVYSVSEVFSYNAEATGGQNYIVSHTVDIDNSPNIDFLTVSYKADYKGDSVSGNFQQLRNTVKNLNPLGELNKYYGFDISTFYTNTLTYNESSGENKISLQGAFYSGFTGDASGLFDYTINLDKDVIRGMQTWNINGTFKSKGKLESRKIFLNSFKNNYLTNGTASYLFGLITGSSLYLSQKDNNHLLCPFPLSSNSDEDSDMATLSLSAQFNNRDYLAYAPETSYQISVEPARPLYRLTPAANIEGHFVIQDLQCRTSEKIETSINVLTSGNPSEMPLLTEKLMQSITGTVLSGNNYRFENSETSGEFNYSKKNKSFTDSTIPLYSDFYGNFNLGAITRRPGQSFGY